MSNEKPIRRSLLDMGISRFANPAPVQEWSVKSPIEGIGLLPAKDPILLVGRGGVGKTFAAMELALKLASWDGTGVAPTWWGQEIATCGVAIVLTYEESTDRIHRSIERMAEATGIDLAVVANRMLVKSFQDVDVTPMPLVGNNPKTRQPAKTKEYDELTLELREVVRTIGPIGCIVIDNVGTAMAIEGNDYQSVNQAMKWLQRWSSEFRCSTILIAHTNKGGLKLTSDDPGDDELEAAAMGSTGWVSAVRCAIVMWSLSEEGEGQIAESLDDKEFVHGVTRRRYIRARVVKNNVDAYNGTITLKRAGGEMLDVTKATKGAKAAERNEEIEEFAAAVGRMWTRQTPVQKSGSRGVFEHRGAMGDRFVNMAKSALAALTNRALASGALRLEALCPGVAKSRGAWLYDTTGRGRRESHLDAFRKARRAADKARLAFKTSNVNEWRRFLEPYMSELSDDQLLEAVAELCDARQLSISDAHIIIGSKA